MVHSASQLLQTCGSRYSGQRALRPAHLPQQQAPRDQFACESIGARRCLYGPDHSRKINHQCAPLYGARYTSVGMQHLRDPRSILRSVPPWQQWCTCQGWCQWHDPTGPSHLKELPTLASRVAMHTMNIHQFGMAITFLRQSDTQWLCRVCRDGRNSAVFESPHARQLTRNGDVRPRHGTHTTEDWLSPVRHSVAVLVRRLLGAHVQQVGAARGPVQLLVLDLVAAVHARLLDAVREDGAAFRREGAEGVALRVAGRLLRLRLHARGGHGCCVGAARRSAPRRNRAQGYAAVPGAFRTRGTTPPRQCRRTHRDGLRVALLPRQPQHHKRGCGDEVGRERSTARGL